jgi:superfamily II DNA or RNA helicase
VNPADLKPGLIVRGPLLPEPVVVLVVQPLGKLRKLIGTGQRTKLTHTRTLDDAQIALLEATPEREPFDGDATRFRLGIEAARLALAHEYDPYFSLSIARVDPLPHQLEAVYDYFMKLPRVRFLLADDPGAGKTIMAGLLIKELKVRGLAKRTLVVTPANLTFQWQRELKDRFRESFEVIRSDVLRANYGANPFQERNQVITSVSWVSVIDDARESLLRSNWDLVIVDEAHKMAAYSADKKTYAYKLGEELAKRTDHFLLMTATPHKGDPENFCLFLELLDRDIYGSVKSLEEAMRRNHAPFYLRRTKEALVTFPDPDTGTVKRLFTKRDVKSAKFDLDPDEHEFYEALTRYVEDQSIKAAEDESARGRALQFTMAMLQRRFASSVYAVRRSLERMRDKRRKILDDPEAHRREQINDRLPEDFDDLPEDEKTAIEEHLAEVVASIDPFALREEIVQLEKLITQAIALEKREVESKLTKLRQVLNENDIFKNPKMKLLVFTEHKDTLDYLAGDGREGRPVGKLRQWGLKTTQIHGGMKIGDRDTPGTRLYAEREFKEQAQVLVATEAAGEGINLQFCWFMVNYDIPWNPVRLEQRMGRIHRYGQPRDCLIFNFIAINTREGKVLNKLLERLHEIRAELGTDQVFDVVGEVFPANRLEKLFREMYAQREALPTIEARIVKEVDAERFRKITHSTLEGLAKKELNLQALIGKSAEARERRLVPEVIEDFFVSAAPIAGVHPRAVETGTHVYRIGKLPRTLLPAGERLEPRFGKLGREYPRVVFDKALLPTDPALEWVTPGHPLFEAVRDEVATQVDDDLRRGAVFFDLQAKAPARLDVYCATIQDGRGNTINRRLFVAETGADGTITIRQPTYFHDLAPAPKGTPVPDDAGLPDRAAVEQALIERSLSPFLGEVAAERGREVKTIEEHLKISMEELIHRANCSLGELIERRENEPATPGIEGHIAQAEARLDELNNRYDNRRAELQRERQCAIGEIQHMGRAWVLPHPERGSPGVAPMIEDEEIEEIAIRAAIAYEEARGWKVEDVQSENRGFDLISRKPHPHDDKTFTDVRFIEVKGRATVGDVALSANEYKTAERLKADYWLYVAFDCAKVPSLHLIRDPAQLDWIQVVRVAHYHVAAEKILDAHRLESGGPRC